MPPVTAAMGIHYYAYWQYPAYHRAHPLLETVSLLLEHGASASLPDHLGYTPLSYACRLDDHNLVRLLSSYVAAAALSVNT
jgi:ankyrin repeat protein